MNLPAYKLFLLSVFCAVVFSACSFQKRLYTNGFYTSNNQAVKKLGIADTAIQLPSFKNLKQLNPALLVQASKTILSTKQNKSICTTTNCDTIVLKSGQKLPGTVTEINNNKIFFKSCGTSVDYTSTIDKNEVAFVSFANGYNGLYNFKIPGLSSNVNDRRIRPLPIIGFVFSILAFAGYALLKWGRSLNYLLSFILLLATLVLWLVGFIASFVALLLSIHDGDKSPINYLLASLGLSICLAILALVFLHR